MPDFVLWRSCDVSTVAGFRASLAEVQAQAARARALLNSPTALPANTDSRVSGAPGLRVVSASWSPAFPSPGSAITAPTVVQYRLTPVSLQTGKTGVPYDGVPALSLQAVEAAWLRVQLEGAPSQDLAVVIERNGVAVGQPISLASAVSAEPRVPIDPVPGAGPKWPTQRALLLAFRCRRGPRRRRATCSWCPGAPMPRWPPWPS